VTFVISALEVPMPSGSELISMLLNDLFRILELRPSQAVILGRVDPGLGPELRFSTSADDVNMNPRLFAREEVEPIARSR